MNVKKGKMKELIHYIIDKCDSKENFGKTVLFKLLYFTDFNHYELTEKSVTNEEYKKYPRGPLPIHFEEFKDELIKEGKIKEEKIHIFPGSKNTKFRYHALKKFNIFLLSPDEINTVDNVINKLSHMNANEISEYSHYDIPWVATEDYESLAYKLVFYRNDPYIVRKT